ncbi:MAG: hypothetical protein J6Q82_02400 [Clostridia bacterium]|nr:hypothetical protein [Clostridia bacterium]
MMSAIAGMVNWNRESIDSRPLFEMSRAMLLRGGAHRDADLHGGTALVQNHAAPCRVRMPCSLPYEGGRYTLLLDGTPTLALSDEELFAPFYDPSSPEEILRAYSSLGGQIADALRGEYALAIADEGRAELLLARSPEGGRPLFYREEEGLFCFASEIRALLRTLLSPTRIDAGQLRTHLLSPYGVCFGEDLYRDVESLPAGHSALLSRLGLRIFQNEPPSPIPDQRPPDFSCPELFFPDEDTLSRMLTEILYAFDYPQFDYLMPALLRELSERRARGTVRDLVFEDGALCMNIRYAHERADRLGSLYGVSLTPVAPQRFFAKERELRKLERILRALLGSVDTAPLRQLLGEDWSVQITREKNTARRIRMEGMVYQTLVWMEHVPLMLL